MDQRHHNSDQQHRTKSLSDGVNGLLYKYAHEPSLAGHVIQEHVYKTVPILLNEQTNISSTVRNIEGSLYDLNYTHEFLSVLEESIHSSAKTRKLVSELQDRVFRLSRTRTLGMISRPRDLA